MGFDLFINVQYNLCPDTGKPYYISKTNFEKVYDLPEINIPVSLRKYLQGRGSIFHAYIHEFDLDDQTSVDVESLVFSYPLWDQVKNSEWYDEIWEEDWTEKEHNEFFELLKYLKENYSCRFNVDWSY
jgi:hypothetical protein